MPQDSPYPEQIATGVNLPDVEQYVDTYDADHMNAVRAFIRDITASLGTNPQGNKSTLVERLAISLNSDGHLVFPQNCIHVGKAGAPFSTIQSAIDSVTDASYLNQYLILVYPGTYEEHVYFKGSVNVHALDPLSTKISKTCYINGPETNCLINIPIDVGGSGGLEMNSEDGMCEIFSPISAGSAPAILQTGGWLRLYNDISSSSSHCIEQTSHFFELRNAVIKLKHGSSTDYPIFYNGDSVHLINCVIINNSYSDYSIVSNSSKDLISMNTWSNKPLHANVNNLISSGFNVDSNVSVLGF